jgi:hypothetical protein
MVTTASVPAPEAQPASISAIGRLTGVLFSPKATFEDIVRKPSWALPVIVLTILSVAASFSINQRINWREFMSQQIEKSPAAANMSAEQKEQRIEGGAKFSPPFTYVIGFVGPILAGLIVGVVVGRIQFAGRSEYEFFDCLGDHGTCVFDRTGEHSVVYFDFVSETGGDGRSRQSDSDKCWGVFAR